MNTTIYYEGDGHRVDTENLITPARTLPIDAIDGYRVKDVSKPYIFWVSLWVLLIILFISVAAESPKADAWVLPGICCAILVYLQAPGVFQLFAAGGRKELRVRVAGREVRAVLWSGDEIAKIKDALDRATAEEPG